MADPLFADEIVVLRDGCSWASYRLPPGGPCGDGVTAVQALDDLLAREAALKAPGASDE